MRMIHCVAAAFVVALFPGVAAASDDDVFGALAWRSVGPDIPTGRMTAIVGTDTDPTLYYAGSADGGIFKTTNSGFTWTPIFQHEKVASIGALAIDPHDARVVWVGTGESNPRQDVSYGDGMYLTHDGGATWRHCGLTRTMQISRILIDPADSSDVLAGALGNPFADSDARGVYRTIDGGRTWKRTLFAGPRSGVAEMARDPFDRNVVFAAVWQYRRTPWSSSSGGNVDGLYKSADGGSTWTHVLGGGFPRAPLGRIGVAFSRSVRGHVFALVEARPGWLWDSHDGGKTWRHINDQSLIDQRGYYFSHVMVDPTNDSHIVAMSADLPESWDGGRHFKEVLREPHSDHHDGWWSSDGRRIVIAQDGGVSLSLDHGKTYAWMSGIVTTQVYHVGYDRQVPYRVCVSIQDTHAYCGPSNSLDPVGIADRHWFDLNIADGSDAWPDATDPNLIWTTYNVGTVNLFDVASQQAFDVSPTPENYVTNFAVDNLPYRYDWTTDLAFDPFDPHVVYFGANVLFKTDDRGRSWSIVSPDLTLNDKTRQRVSGGPIELDVTGAENTDTIIEIAPSPARTGIIWVGTDDGLIQLTRDGGASWKNVTPSGLPRYGRFESISPSTNDPAAAYAVLDRHLIGDRRPYVFKTNDYGASWTAISHGLPPNAYAHAVREDISNSTLVYLGTEQGLYASYDAGETWRSLQLNLPTTAVYDIRIQPDFNDILVGTHGRGLWILDDASPVQQYPAARMHAVHFFRPRTAYQFWYWNAQFSWNYDIVQTAPINVYTADNPPAGAIVDYFLAKPLAHAPVLTVRDAAGKTVATLRDLPNRRGVNRAVWTLTEDAPAPFVYAREASNAPAGLGAPVVPGEYVATLDADGQQLPQPLIVKADPRARWAQADYESAHAIDAAVVSDLDRVDKTLNTIVEDVRSSTTSASCRAQLLGLKRRLTFDQEEFFFQLHEPPGIRERLINLQLFQTSQGPPLPRHVAQQQKLHAQLEDVLADYHRLACN